MRFADENGFFELNPFPGCNQLVISNHALIYPDKRGQGLGKQQVETRIETATELGYDYLICTIKGSNEVQLRNVALAGYQILDHFFSTETGSMIFILGRKLERS